MSINCGPACTVLRDTIAERMRRDLSRLDVNDAVNLLVGEIAYFAARQAAFLMPEASASPSTRCGAGQAVDVADCDKRATAAVAATRASRGDGARCATCGGARAQHAAPYVSHAFAAASWEWPADMGLEPVVFEDGGAR